MASNQFKDPIVREKPARGREMQTKMIPKGMVEKLKSTRGSDRALGSDGTSERAKVGLYYEGYIDGKMYLVPDTNLEAMKDMVNLKMRRVHSSCEKPRTSLDEPTQYNEFNSKLDGLLEKVDMLSMESDSSLETEGKPETSRNTPQILNYECVRSSIGKLGKREGSSEIVVEPEEETPEEPRVSVKVEAKQEEICPPLLDNSIKYKRVRPKDPSKREYIRELIKYKQQKNVESHIGETEMITENFRLIISGHLKDGLKPIFIVHQNYTGPNILENLKLDFESRQQEGNVDIFISGKFFTNDILQEETPESPALINVDSRQILVDKLSNVHSERFKDEYSLGPVKVGLEGEFIKDGSTFKFTPALSLEIVKLPLLEKQFGARPFSDNERLVTVMQTELNKRSPFHKNKTKIKPLSDVEIENKTVTIHLASKNKPALKYVLKRLKKTPLLKKILTKTPKTKNISGETSQKEPLALEEIPQTKEREEHQTAIKSKEKSSYFRMLIPKLRKGKKSTKAKKDKNSLEQSPSTSASIYEERGAEKPITDTEESNMSKSKKLKKVKRGKKNQAIIENPILAQMQEFFIA